MTTREPCYLAFQTPDNLEENRLVSLGIMPRRNPRIPLDQTEPTTLPQVLSMSLFPFLLGKPCAIIATTSWLRLQSKMKLTSPYVHSLFPGIRRTVLLDCTTRLGHRQSSEEILVWLF